MDQVSVLIVEDDALVALELSRNLRAMGYRVVGISTSREEAFEYIRRDPPKVVLMDIRIKGDIDGIELAGEIGGRANLPVIFLTSYSDDQTLGRATRVEPYGFLSKGSSRKDIHSTIVTALQQHRIKCLIEEQKELLSLTLRSIEDGVLTSDRDGQILFYNSRATELFLLPPYEKRIPPGVTLDRRVELFTASGTRLSDPFRHRSLPSQLVLRRIGMEEIPLKCRVSHYTGGAILGAERIYTFSDISHQQQLQEMQARLSLLVESSEDVIASVSEHGVVTSWNLGAQRLLGLSAGDAIGVPLGKLFPDLPIPRWFSSRESNRGFHLIPPFIGQYRTPDGGILFLSVLISPLKSIEGDMVGLSFIARNVTERIELERRILYNETKERERIGRDLHDGLGQQLTGISLKNRVLQRYLQDGDIERVQGGLIEQEDLITTATEETRRLSRGLMPNEFRGEGISSAVRELAQHYIDSGISIECSIDDEIQLDGSVQFHLCYIVQEAVNNAIRHGGAKLVTIRLHRDGAGGSLSVTDTGGGFDHEVIEDGLGLNNMRYRSDMIGGRLSIRSAVGVGTEVTCTFPSIEG